MIGPLLCAALWIQAQPFAPADARPPASRTAQEKGQAAPSRPEAGRPSAFTTADALGLVAAIREVGPAAFRAYLYAHASAFLWERGAADAPLRRVAADAAANGVADIDESFDEIPPAVAQNFAREMLAVVARLDAEEAARLKRAHPTPFPSLAGAEKAAADLHAALKKLGDGGAASHGLEEAARLVERGGVPPASLQGEILRLDMEGSPALPRLLAAVLTGEEREPGSLPLMTMYFLSHIFLKEAAPPDVRARFIAAVVRAPQQPPGAQGRPSPAESWVVPLLQAVLPHARKLTPELYPVVAARLAALAPGPSPGEVFARLEESEDPAGAAASEAAFTSDARLKRELLRYAAFKARERGLLRRAAELMASTEEEPGVSEWYSSRDEFLEDLCRRALQSGDVETARYAESSVKVATYRASALRLVARHFVKTGDAQLTGRALDEAAKVLKEAADGKEKALALLLLASDAAEVDAARARDFARAAVKAADGIRRSKGEEAGRFNWHLFPVADAAAKAFGLLAANDREGALALAQTFSAREFRLAATLGVYGAGEAGAP